MQIFFFQNVVAVILEWDSSEGLYNFPSQSSGDPVRAEGSPRGSEV